MTAGRWQIPQSWQWVEMQEISEVVGGGTPNASDSSNFDPDGTPWLTPADLSGYQETYISKGSRNLSTKGMAACGAKVMPEGAVLFTSRAPIGYVAIAANPIATNQGFKSFVLATDCVPEFFRYYLKSSKAYAESMASGSTFLELSGGRAKELVAPLAPTNEQRRIVAKLDTLFEKSRSIREKLDRLPRLLANLQKSILNSAFRGDLTKEWRANNPNVEPASELLKRIRAERRAKWEADLIAKGKDPKKAKYVEPEPVDTEGLPELPEGWCWASMPMIASTQPNALKAGPFGSALKKSDYTEQGFKVYGQEQVIRGNPYFGDYFIPEEKFQELSSCAVCPGDVLISLVGTAGKVLVLPEDSAPGIINPRLVKISVAQRHINPHYIARYIQSPMAQRFFRESAHGGTMEILNLGILKQLVVPIPPLPEQEQVLTMIAAIEERRGVISDLLEKASRSREISEQAFLSRAFRGELVPQNPNDEPASVLLERIRAQKPAAGTKRGRGRKAAT